MLVDTEGSRGPPLAAAVHSFHAVPREKKQKVHNLDLRMEYCCGPK
jgi:hypothetical protein